MKFNVGISAIFAVIEKEHGGDDQVWVAPLQECIEAYQEDPNDNLESMEKNLPLTHYPHLTINIVREDNTRKPRHNIQSSRLSVLPLPCTM